MKRRLFLRMSHWREMLAHVDRQAPLEACGLLAGREDQVEKVFLVRNKAQSLTRFVMDPQEQLRAFDWIESNRLALLAIFHSHPAGPERVSATDIAQAAYEVVHIIWSRTEDIWEARGFWIENGSATEVALQLVE